MLLSRAFAFVAVLVCAGGLCGCAASFTHPGVVHNAERREAAAIRDTLDAQVQAWNRGDIEGYMSAYWNSEQLCFSAGGQTHHGWQATYERYCAKYPTPERMGRLVLSGLDIRWLGDASKPYPSAYVLGRWYLHRTPDPVGGNFSLVLQKLPEGWRILHDHTSLDPQAQPPGQP